MKILLTGSTGGIGSAIHKVLEGNEVICPTGDVRTLEYMADIPPIGYDWLIFAHGTIDESDMQDTFDVNLLSNIYMTQHYAPRKGVIYISSTAGINGNGKFPIYAASKAALNSYTKSMAMAHPEVGFYAICPGPTDTKMWRDLKLEGTPQKPEAVAEAVQWVMSGEVPSGNIIIVRNGVSSCHK